MSEKRRNVREDEAITVGPVGVLGVEVHELVEENVSDGGHAHGGTGVTGVGLEGGIDLGLSISIDSSFSLLVGRGVVKRGNSVKKEKKKKRPI